MDPTRPSSRLFHASTSLWIYLTQLRQEWNVYRSKSMCVSAPSRVLCRLPAGQRRAWWNQPSSPIFAHRDSRFIQPNAIPKLARHLLVHLIEPFTIVCEHAASNLIPTAEFDLQKPVRVSKRLPGCADDIRFAVSKNIFRLLKSRDSSRSNHRRRKS